MNKLYVLIFAVFILTLTSLNAQVKDYELGTSTAGLINRTGGLFDYSDPLSINIKVAVWGFVKYPGRYIVPESTTLTDLISLAGGPSDDAHMNDLRLYRTDENQNQSMFKFDYNDIMWEEGLTSIKKEIPDLQAGDILVVPGSPRLYFQNWFSITLSVISTLISLTILVFNVINK